MNKSIYGAPTSMRCIGGKKRDETGYGTENSGAAMESKEEAELHAQLLRNLEIEYAIWSCYEISKEPKKQGRKKRK